jgi:hypothetical protein
MIDFYTLVFSLFSHSSMPCFFTVSEIIRNDASSFGRVVVCVQRKLNMRRTSVSNIGLDQEHGGAERYRLFPI